MTLWANSKFTKQVSLVLVYATLGSTFGMACSDVRLCFISNTYEPFKLKLAQNLSSLKWFFVLPVICKVGTLEKYCCTYHLNWSVDYFKTPKVSKWNKVPQISQHVDILIYTTMMQGDKILGWWQVLNGVHVLEQVDQWGAIVWYCPEISLRNASFCYRCIYIK